MANFSLICTLFLFIDRTSILQTCVSSFPNGLASSSLSSCSPRLHSWKLEILQMGKTTILMDLKMSFWKWDLPICKTSGNLKTMTFHIESKRILITASYFFKRYMLEPGCNQNHYHSNDTILLVTSRSSNFHLRDAQRRAYPDKYLRKHFGMRRIFLLAYDPLVTYELLTKESREFDDILMGDFREDYLNLSLKHIMGLQWASSSCNRKR